MTKTVFRDPSAFAESGPWRFMPFRFHRLSADRVLLTNQGGEFALLDTADFDTFAGGTVPSDSSLHLDLKSKGFLTHGPDETELRVAASQFRTKKAFLEGGPKLHIFVPTLRCNQGCGYCQVSRAGVETCGVDMTSETASKAIDIMLSCPAKAVTMEFQGGEALLAFDMVKWMTVTASERAAKLGKAVRFVICTNLTLLTDEHLTFFAEHGVSVSTSLDGPAFLHDRNRPISGGGAHDIVVRNIARCNEALGSGFTSALMTSTVHSLPHARAIIDEYIAVGQKSIFLRDLNPYGYAIKTGHALGYDTDLFLDFYREALAYIIELNRNGTFFSESFACTLLRKIMTPFGVGFVDLQSPTGEGFGVVLYNHDGSVYASDEARMLGEMGDFTYRLGTVNDSYAAIFFGETMLDIAAAGVAESLPGCSDCTFVPYCGADPIRHYRTQGDPVGHRPTSSFCRKNMGVFRHLFGLLDSGDPEIERIFLSWLMPSRTVPPRPTWQP